MMRSCKVCNVSKPFGEFPVRKWTTSAGESRSAPRYVCFVCQRDLDNARYNAPNSKKRASKLAHDAANQEAKRAYRAEYYQTNRDKWLNKADGWRSSERAKAYDREYRAKNAARLKILARAWREANKPHLLAKTRAPS